MNWIGLKKRWMSMKFCNVNSVKNAIGLVISSHEMYSNLINWEKLQHHQFSGNSNNYKYVSQNYFSSSFPELTYENTLWHNSEDLTYWFMYSHNSILFPPFSLWTKNCLVFTTLSGYIVYILIQFMVIWCVFLQVLRGEKQDAQEGKVRR